MAKAKRTEVTESTISGVWFPCRRHFSSGLASVRQPRAPSPEQEHDSSDNSVDFLRHVFTPPPKATWVVFWKQSSLVWLKWTLVSKTTRVISPQDQGAVKQPLLVWFQMNCTFKITLGALPRATENKLLSTHGSQRHGYAAKPALAADKNLWVMMRNNSSALLEKNVHT